MPDKTPSPMPVQCALDRAKIETIEKTVNKISGQMDDLVSMEGPISRVQQRLAIVEGAADRAHTRLDHTDAGIEDLSKSWATLAFKVGALLTPIAAGIGALIAKFYNG